MYALGGGLAKAKDALTTTGMPNMEQQLKFFEDMGSVGSIVVEDKSIRVMKRVPTTLEEKQQMHIQYAKLDLKLEAVLVPE
jgi:hypothetical protein